MATGNEDFFAYRNDPKRIWEEQANKAYADYHNAATPSRSAELKRLYDNNYGMGYDAYMANLSKPKTPTDPKPLTPTDPKPSTPTDTTAADAAKKAAADAAAKKAAEDKAALDKAEAGRAGAIKAGNIQDYNKALGKAQEQGRLGQINAQSQVAQMNKSATETNPIQMGEAGSQMDQSARQAVGGGGFNPVAAMRQQMGSSGGAGYGGPSQEKKVGAGAYAQAQETNKTGSGRNAFQLPNTSNITFGGV